ncbi:sugar phosphate isomerase/epimerase family protein [Streptomyces sp. NPDC020490]|uniref:sugar phosphate isomerase/epimerase family protein n=1 Tax=Streptomyces sp. NPDC020490 TaxID=3365078 RepID=UPI00379DE93D
MNTLGTPVQGVTLYSFTRAFHGRRHSFEELVREVARRGLGPGLELVGFQSIKGFPDVDPAFVDRFRSLTDETGLVPTCLSANADSGLRRDRMLTDDELVDYMRPQIAVARELGFPVVRVQISLTPDDMERLLPVAEQYGVRLGLEIHSHQHPRHPRIQALLERYEKLGSPLLGFVPDWGASLRAVPSTLLRKYRAAGYPEDLVQGLERLWREHHAEGPPMTEPQHGRWFRQVMELAHRHGAGGRAIEMAVNITGLFGHAPASDWADVLPWTVHTHGKFYEIDADGDEPSVPVRELVDLWVRSGYLGAISSEWEGFHWNDWDDPFDVVAGEQALVRASAEAAGSRVIVDPAEARALVGRPAERNN